MAATMVTENCLYISPVAPPKNAMGTKTAETTMAMPNEGPLDFSHRFFRGRDRIEMLVAHDAFDVFHHHDRIHRQAGRSPEPWPAW